MPWTLVVVGPRLPGAHLEGPSRNVNLPHEDRPQWHPDLGGKGGEHGGGDQLQGGQQRLDVLLLVLGHHAVDEATVEESASARDVLVVHRLEAAQRPRANFLRVGDGLLRSQQRELAADPSRGPERVVEPVGLGAGEPGLAERPEEPLLLVVGDVGHVPDRWRHERGVLRHQDRRRNGTEEVQQPGARGRQRLPREVLPGEGPPELARVHGRCHSSAVTPAQPSGVR
jgi:hypothetical protein